MLITMFFSEIRVMSAEVAAATYIAGFILRNLVDKFPCHEAVMFLLNTNDDSLIYEFIRLNDREGLLYPKEELVNLVLSVFQLLDKFLYSFRTWNNCTSGLVNILKSPVVRSQVLTCGCGDEAHSDRMVNQVLKQIVKIYLQNVANRETNLNDKPATERKPLCRKVLKLS